MIRVGMSLMMNAHFTRAVAVGDVCEEMTMKGLVSVRCLPMVVCDVMFWFLVKGRVREEVGERIAIINRIRTVEKEDEIIVERGRVIESLTESSRKQIEISSFIANPMVLGFVSRV